MYKSFRNEHHLLYRNTEPSGTFENKMKKARPRNDIIAKILKFWLITRKLLLVQYFGSITESYSCNDNLKEGNVNILGN